MEEVNGKEQNEIWPISPPKTARSKVAQNWSRSWDSMHMDPIHPVMDTIRGTRPPKSANKSMKKVDKDFNSSFDTKKVITNEVIDNTVKTNTEKTIDKTIEKSIEKTIEESIEKTIEETIEKPIEETTEETTEKPIDQTVNNDIEVKEEKVLTNENIITKVIPKKSMEELKDNLQNELKKQKTANYVQKIAKKKVNRIKKIKPTNVKIKRNRIRPLIVKNLWSSQGFLDFVSKKFPPIKEGVPFIQDRSCKELAKEYESLKLNCCLECSDDKTRNDSQTCRFLQYRTLVKKGDKLSVYAFAEEGNATHDDCKIWLPLGTQNSVNLDYKTAVYLSIFVGQQFCRIYSKERQISNRFLSVTWKRPVKGIRELCDNCQTTIFNCHYVCPKCGLAICVDCYDFRANREHSSLPLSYNLRKNHDNFGWIHCTDKETHDLKTFHLAVFITQAVFGSIDTIYHRSRNELKIQGLCDCGQLLPELNLDVKKDFENLNIIEYCPSVPRQWLCNNTLLILTDPKFEDNLKLFQIDWIKGYPVIIENVNQSLNQELWSPKSFNHHFGKQTSRLVDCMDGQVIPRRPMKDFWDGFEEVTDRLVSEQTGEEMILKLKDWPPNAEFRDKLPLWFDNLMDALPLPEYTRYNGNRNLASRLPEFFVRPDLGPKMYCAYGSVLHPEKGTTNLHLDMSDAVNVMIYVGVAQKDNKPLQSHLDEANHTLIKGGCDQQMMARANSAGHKVGALWHIWKAEDADKIREFLNKVAKQRNLRIEANNDPIHDQSWYLDQNLRTRLEDEYNVKGLAIAQCFGDAILVPAGAPHQVQNIHSCIKVAGEFVSPENVAHCLTMTQQFRNLSKRHNNHEDKLQVKNIIYHTIKDCLAVLLPSLPVNCFPIPAPPNLVSQRQPSIPNKEFTLNGSSLQFKDVSIDEQMTDSEEELLTPPLPTLQTPFQRNITQFDDKLTKIESIESNNWQNYNVTNGDCLRVNGTDSVKCSQNDIKSKEFKSESIKMESSESCETSQLLSPPLSPPPLVNPLNHTFEEKSLSPPPLLTPYNDESLLRTALHNSKPLK